MSAAGSPILAKRSGTVSMVNVVASTLGTSSQVMGVETGAPGAGKSSLVDKLATIYRQRGERVGIIVSGGNTVAVNFGV